LRFKAASWRRRMGVLDRLMLSDEAWARMAPHIIGTERTRGSAGRDNRMLVEGVLWIVRTGAPWRDLPEAFGACVCRPRPESSFRWRPCAQLASAVLERRMRVGHSRNAIDDRIQR
jgi:transposase